jgi:predicted DNA-binding protein
MRARLEPKTTITSFQFPTDLLERLREVAHQRDCSMAAAVREAVRKLIRESAVRNRRSRRP